MKLTSRATTVWINSRVAEMQVNLLQTIRVAAAAGSTSRSRLRQAKILCSTDSKPPEVEVEEDPATQFPPLAAKFGRRVAVGTIAASTVAVGGNLGGITSSILSFQPQSAQRLKLDAVYPVLGFKRCIDPLNRFEFVYPSTWVGDQTLLYRAVERAENERSFGPSKKMINEPVVAFGPPGSSGELNVSVIVSQIPAKFTLQIFQDPKEAGEIILNNFIAPRNSNISASLLDAKKEDDYTIDRNVTYYYLEYSVQGPSFSRHNVAVYSASSGNLFTLNAQCPESSWPEVKDDFSEIVNSFKVNI